jgi:formate dehydrogenase major subunit
MVCYAVGLTMHSKGVQNIRSLGVLQLLLGNIGRPGGGILALRGHANVQGATDLPVLYDLWPGYLPKPTADDVDLAGYLERVAKPTGWWANTPAYVVSLLKAWFGDAATAENDYCFDRMPRLTGDHSYMVTQAAMADGAVEGMMVAGENVSVSSVHGSLQRSGFRKLRWMVVRDLTMIETAEFWKRGEEYAKDRGEDRIDPADVDTEVFLFPAAAHVEKEGSFTNTQRILQWKDQAVVPPGDARSELWFTHHLMARLRDIYADSTDLKDQPILDGTWDYEVEGALDEPSANDVLAEIGGFGPDGPLSSFGELRDDGTTSAGGLDPRRGHRFRG